MRRHLASRHRRYRTGALGAVLQHRCRPSSRMSLRWYGELLRSRSPLTSLPADYCLLVVQPTLESLRWRRFRHCERDVAASTSSSSSSSSTHRGDAVISGFLECMRRGLPACWVTALEHATASVTATADTQSTDAKEAHRHGGYSTYASDGIEPVALYVFENPLGDVPELEAFLTSCGLQRTRSTDRLPERASEPAAIACEPPTHSRLGVRVCVCVQWNRAIHGMSQPRRRAASLPTSCSVRCITCSPCTTLDRHPPMRMVCVVMPCLIGAWRLVCQVFIGGRLGAHGRVLHSSLVCIISSTQDVRTKRMAEIHSFTLTHSRHHYRRHCC